MNQMIPSRNQKYCGSELPGENGTIMSVFDSFYVRYFANVATNSRFTFSWNITDPSKANL